MCLTLPRKCVFKLCTSWFILTAILVLEISSSLMIVYLLNHNSAPSPLVFVLFCVGYFLKVPPSMEITALGKRAGYFAFSYVIMYTCVICLLLLFMPSVGLDMLA